jgi:hypothetical protein
MSATKVYENGSYSVVLDSQGFTVRDSFDRFIAGVFPQKFAARQMADKWAAVAPLAHSAEWWTMYRESNPQLDQCSLDNIGMLIRRADA